MKKFIRASELLWVLGLIFVALGVALCSKADLGVSMIAAPAFILQEFLAPIWPGCTVGMMEYLFQGLLLVILCLLLHRITLRYLLSFAVAMLYGGILNLFLFLLRGLVLSFYWQKVLLLLVGDVVCALGVACFFETYLPLQVYELFVSEIASFFSKNLHKVKLFFDASLLVVSLVLVFSLFGFSSFLKELFLSSYHAIGLGTLLTALINAPIIALMNRVLHLFFGSQALFPSLEKFFKS